MRDLVRERYLKWTFWSGGVSTLKTFSEFIFSDILGNVYPTKEKGNIGYGLRARHKINAGSRVFMYGPSGDTKIGDYYFGRVWSFREYFENYGFDDEQIQNQELRRLFDQEGLWRGYPAGYQEKKRVRADKDSYIVTSVVIHGNVESLEKEGDRRVRVVLGQYRALPVTYPKHKQIVFCSDSNNDVFPIGQVVESGESSLVIELLVAVLDDDIVRHKKCIDLMLHVKYSTFLFRNYQNYQDYNRHRFLHGILLHGLQLVWFLLRMPRY